VKEPFKFQVDKEPGSYTPVDILTRNYNTMPPAFLVNKYKFKQLKEQTGEFTSKGHTVTGRLTYGEVMVDIDEDLLLWLKDEWKKNEPNEFKYYAAWPPRFAIASNAARENNRKLKLKKWVVYRAELVDMFGTLRRTEATEFAAGWVSNCKQHLRYDDYTKQYVSHHQEAHPTRGITWGELLKLDMMDDLFEFTGDFVDAWDEWYLETGNWGLNIDLTNFGIRGRSPKIGFGRYLEFVLDQARQIGYVPGPSSSGAFYRHRYQRQYMRRIFDEYEGLLGCKIISPKTEGGKIYTILRDFFLDGHKLQNFDVSGMELITPSVINGQIGNLIFGLGCVTAYLGDIPELLSGVNPTSDYDMIAHLEMLRPDIKKPIVRKRPKMIDSR
jgi:hypothetical protein